MFDRVFVSLKKDQKPNFSSNGGIGVQFSKPLKCICIPEMDIHNRQRNILFKC